MTTFFMEIDAYIIERPKIRVSYHGNNKSALNFDNARLFALRLGTIKNMMHQISSSSDISENNIILLKLLNKESDFRKILNKLKNI